jgi:PEP-CTERM motif
MTCPRAGFLGRAMIGIPSKRMTLFKGRIQAMRAHTVFASAAALTALGFSAAMSPAIAAGYSFVTINSSGGDADFTQLLGINNAGTIAGYFGDGTVVPNNGFTIKPPYGAGDFTPENYPMAAQTQVVGINNTGTTVGFYIDTAGNNIGFSDVGGTFFSVTNPNATPPSPAGTSFTQLTGVNNSNIASGFYTNGTTGATDAFLVNLASATFVPVTLPASFDATATTATGVNNSNVISGFYTDGATGDTNGFLENGDMFFSLSDPNAVGTTMAFGLNNKNEVVGSYVDADGNTHGFVYDWVTGVWTTINDPNADGTTAFGVEGTLVNGINDLGQLVGFYANTDQPAVNGFLANPIPEPSTWAMMMAGFVGIGFLGYRASRERNRLRPAVHA